MENPEEKRKYWYKFFIYECPICGRGDTYKERQYTPKPEDGSERYDFAVHYDYCNV